MRDKILFLGLIVLVVGLNVGCGSINQPQNQARSSVISIVVSPESVSLSVGSTQQFSAREINGSNESTVSASWEVLGDIGTIGSNGVFSATKVGSGTIEAVYKGMTCQANIIVSTRTISGHVYDWDHANFILGDSIPIEGASVYIDGELTTTESDGSFSISGFSAGEHEITAMKYNYDALTIVTDKDSIKLYIVPINSSGVEGVATCAGKISGLPTADTNVNGYAINGLNYYPNFTYNAGASNYTLIEAPESGKSDIFAYYSSGQETIYSYDKYIASSGTIEINLEFGPFKSLQNDFSVPTNFKASGIGIYAKEQTTDGTLFMGPIYSRSLGGESSLMIDKAPLLQPGDEYAASMYITNTSNPNQTIMKYIYGVSTRETINFDFSDKSGLELLAPTPNDGTIIISNPTISWEAVVGENVVYNVDIYNEGGNYQEWQALTDKTNINIPDSFKFIPGVPYTIGVSAVTSKGLDVCDLGSYKVAQYDTLWYVHGRKFYFNSMTAGISSLILDESQKLIKGSRNLLVLLSGNAHLRKN